MKNTTSNDIFQFRHMSDTNQLNVAIINNIYSRQMFSSWNGMDKNSACYSLVETESLVGMMWEHKDTTIWTNAISKL